MAKLKRRLRDRGDAMIDIIEVYEEEESPPQFKTSARILTKPPTQIRISKITV